jgi:predicted transcriptional regulator
MADEGLLVSLVCARHERQAAVDQAERLALENLMLARRAAELERRLDQLALSLGKSRSSCVREAIALYVDRFSGGEEALRQSRLIRQQAGSTHWSEQLPDWTDWTA